MSKSIDVVPIIEDPVEVALQFHVKTNGEKEPKYSQKQIFELGKKDWRKGKSKADRLKEARARAVAGSVRSQHRQSELRKKGYDIG